jgi:hypothetical protein
MMSCFCLIGTLWHAECVDLGYCYVITDQHSPNGVCSRGLGMMQTQWR